jgi:hypothetical protein
LSAPVFSEMGAQPSGRVTRVPAELILAISWGVNALKNDMGVLSAGRWSSRPHPRGRVSEV